LFVSLRERKKAETRQRIADLATPMFIERGFDNVTINEIADAAGVSKVTVFNYFPRKEDIFFDRFPQVRDLLTQAIEGRGTAETPVAALRRLIVGLAREGHPIGGFRDRYVHFWRTVLDSPALRARTREALFEFEAHLAGLLTGIDPDPELTAAVVLAVVRTAFSRTAARMLAGEKAADVQQDHLAEIENAFTTLERGLR
jgi:AcrR family transcriptional regulator